MKRINYLLLFVSAIVTVACNKVSFKKTKSGLLYKIYPSKTKDSLIKDNNVVKFHVITKLNDSVLYSSYGKAPAYVQIRPLEEPSYNLLEILPLMKNGDSAVTVQMVDTLRKKNAQVPEYAKKGDKLTTTFRIIQVFTVDSLAMADYNKEMEKDRPRQMKEQEELRAKMEVERLEQEKKEDAELEKSGEIARELKAIEDYLASKKIAATKTGKGTYVHIQQQGTGPFAVAGKYVTVKYTGRILTTDSVFQSSEYSFPLGKREVIRGWDEGLTAFREGGKGTLFIPGFLAYGKNPQPGSPFKPFDALIFDVELKDVSDTLPASNPARIR